jgi:hypothetical protein
MKPRVSLLAVCAVGLAVWLVRSASRPLPPAAVPASARIERDAAQPAAVARWPATGRTPVQEATRPGTFRLEGQVVDQGELPVRGADVTVDTMPPRTATSREDGTFEFLGLPGRVYRLQARREGQLAGPVSAALTASSEPVILRMRIGGAIEVQVLEKRGLKPVANASVELRTLARVRERTDQEGRAVLEGIAPGVHGLKVSAAGFADAFKVVSCPGPKAVRKELVLLDGGSPFDGKVVDAAGAPIAGATVWLEEVGAIVSAVDPATDGTQTDALGQWRIEVVRRGVFHAAATHREHAPALSAPVASDGLTGRSGIVIAMQPGGGIGGHVLGEDGRGEGLALVRVAHDLAGLQDASLREVRADAAGYFEVKGLPRRPIQLMALTEDAISRAQIVDLRTSARADGVVLRLLARGSIEGVVVAPSGEAVPEAQIIAVDDTPVPDDVQSKLRGPLAAVADGAGRFRLPGLERGSFRLRAAWPGTSPGAIWQVRGLSVAAPSRDVRLVVERPGRVQGRVAFGAGGSPAVFSVSLPLAAATSFAGTDGKFVLESVPAGEHTLVVSSPEFLAKSVEGVTVPGGELVDVGTITVDAGRAVGGYVTDASGRPVPGARVAGGQVLVADGAQLGGQGALHEALGMLQTTSADDGRFLLSGVPRDPFLIAAESDAGRSQILQVAGGTESVELNLRIGELGAIEGAVRRAGESVSGALVSAAPQGIAGGQLVGRTSADGSYRIDKLPAGPYLITATLGAAGSTTSRTISISVQSGEDSHADIDLDAGPVTVRVSAARADVTAQVLLLAGATSLHLRTVAELQTFLASRASGASRSGLIAGGKDAVLLDVVPGPYHLCCIVLPGDLSDPNVLQILQRNSGKLPVACDPVRIPDGVLDYALPVSL